MGQLLSSPVVEKKTALGSNKRFMFSNSCMQGWRPTMEDAHLCNLALCGDDKPDYSMFAVFDGHGGSSVATCASARLDTLLIENDSFKKGNYEEALRATFFELDEVLRSLEPVERHPSGSTCVCALLTDEWLYVANAGDSRAVLATVSEVLPLSYDHKPDLPAERSRIVNSGGYVEANRVNGNLALSRAFGDYEFKLNRDLPAESQAVTVLPDVTAHKLGPSDEFLVLACDGIWDCITNEECATYIRTRIVQGCNLVQICEDLLDYCLAPPVTRDNSGLGCDNMTVIIVAFLNGRTDDEWYAWVRENHKDLACNDLNVRPPRFSMGSEADINGVQFGLNSLDES